MAGDGEQDQTMKKISLCGLLAGLFYLGNAFSADPEAIRTQATTICASCHGVKGISASEALPNLQGQKVQYLSGALKAYREGSRKAPVMNHMAANLTDDEIEGLARYFSALQP